MSQVEAMKIHVEKDCQKIVALTIDGNAEEPVAGGQEDLVLGM